MRADGAGEGDDDPTGEAAPVADAVLYLMRHLHSTDVGFLEAFHDGRLAGVTPSTRSECCRARTRWARAGWTPSTSPGGSRPTTGATRGCGRWCRRCCRSRGCSREAAVGLRERDAAALAALAAGGTAADALLLSAQRFAAPDGPDGIVPAAARRELLAAMGLSGVRLSVALLRAGSCTTRSASRASCGGAAGSTPCGDTLLTRFTERRDVLKAQAALGAVERVLARRPVPGAERLSAQVEATVAGAHELVELRLLGDLRTGVAELGDDDLTAEAEALLGANGTDVRARLLPARGGTGRGPAPGRDRRGAAVAAARREPGGRRDGAPDRRGAAPHRRGVARRDPTPAALTRAGSEKPRVIAVVGRAGHLIAVCGRSRSW